MSYDDPKPQHRNALAQINDARQRALSAVSEARKVKMATPHRNLAPATPEGEQPSFPVLATQAVADYLLQLRPYRQNSRNWNVEFGVVQLPKQVARRPSQQEGPSGGSGLRICRQPEVPLRDASELIAALNMNVTYSTNKPSDNHTPAYHPTPDGNTRSKDQEWQPATPSVTTHEGDTPGPDGKLKNYKFIFGPQRLLRIVEVADEVAAEMDLLAELEAPDHTADGNGAV